jgi:hypothetical protein
MAIPDGLPIKEALTRLPYSPVDKPVGAVDHRRIELFPMTHSRIAPPHQWRDRIALLAPATAGVLSLISALAFADDLAPQAGKIDPLKPIEGLTQPLATGLDFSRFNKKEGFFNPREHGEILHFFDPFLAAQGISSLGSPDDLDRLVKLIQADVTVTEKREAEVDSRYDVLDEQIEDIEEAFEDERFGKDEDEKEKDGKSKKKKNRDDKKDGDDKKDDKPKAKPDLARLLKLKDEIEPFRDERKRLRDWLDQEKPCLVRLEAARVNPADERLRIEACHFAIHTLFTLMADQVMADHGDRDFQIGLRSGIQYTNHFLGRPGINSIRYHDPARSQAAIGLWNAKREASNLCRPGDLDRFLDASELARLTPAAIGNLDVSPDNPLWHTRRHMEVEKPDTWKLIENYVADRATAELMDKKKFRKAHPDFRYDLNAARRVLFWDGVKTSSTSPKIDTIDAFGQEWKMKWADEAVVEPFGNRLRARLGAKFCDLTYVDVGGDSHLLILPGREDQKFRPDDAMPRTVDELISVMENSAYRFNIVPFIRESGTVTAQNAAHILRHLPAEARKGHRRQDLIGRVWVSFKESMVEAKQDVVNLGGPAPLFSDVTLGDRALRQSFIFSLWMEDKDNKEANFRTAWLSDFAGRPSQFVEYFHDTGFSFGGLARAAEVNKLRVGDRPGGFMWLNREKTQILASTFQIYRPTIWKDVTYSDCLAGAKHISRLTRDEIAAVISHSHMPDFWQQALVWRLANRRDVIADIFGLTAPDAAGPAPDFAIPLTTRKDRSAAATRYGVPLYEIESDLMRTGHLAAGKPAADTVKPFLDLVVKDGEIQPTEKTVLIGILRDFRHPSGLVKRSIRWNHSDPYESVRFQTH